MADTAYPQPRWRVTLDGADISGKIAPRLMALSITSERGQDADQLDLTLTDHDGRLALTRASGDAHRYHTADRDAYTGVKAQWHNLDDGGTEGVIAGDETNAKVLRTTYATQADAETAAKAEKARLDRGAATFELTLARGRADLYPEMTVTVQGFKAGIDGIVWLIKRVEHTLGDGGYTTRLECERAGPTAAQVPITPAKPLDDSGDGGL